MMQLHRLALLRELAARGTIAAVAQALAYTPSAVSQQLHTLEREVGVALLERHGRRVRLTAAGQALVARADEVFEATERARSAALAAADDLAGEVRVGSYASIGATIISRAFRRLADDEPGLALYFHQFEDEGMRELLLGHLDVWIDQQYSVLPTQDTAGLHEQALLTEPVCLAVPADHDRGHRLAAYRERTWAGGSADTDHGRMLHRLTGDAGFAPDLRYVTDDLEVTVQLVAAGVAVAILPRLATARVPEGVVVHPLPGHERRVIALTREASTDQPAVTTVLAALVRAGDEAQEALDPAGLTSKPR
jgi:DNA-binding transcriptional LysR family regulator